MLQSFLKQNKVALSNPVSQNQESFSPSLYQFQKPCCLDWHKENNQKPAVVTAPTSPRYRRKKIFQNESPQKSELTAAFQPSTVEESRVESYGIESKEEIKTPISEKVITMEKKLNLEEFKPKPKKGKITKENALVLKEKDRPFKKNLKSMETIPSTLKEIMP